MLEYMANRAAKRELGRPLEEVFVDPASVMLYTTIITKTIKLLKRCKEAHEVAYVADNPSKKEIAIIRRIVRREIGLFKYLKNGNSIVNSVIEEGKRATNAELRQLYREIK